MSISKITKKGKSLLRYLAADPGVQRATAGVAVAAAIALATKAIFRDS